MYNGFPIGGGAPMPIPAVNAIACACAVPCSVMMPCPVPVPGQTMGVMPGYPTGVLNQAFSTAIAQYTLLFYS